MYFYRAGIRIENPLDIHALFFQNFAPNVKKKDLASPGNMPLPR